MEEISEEPEPQRVKKTFYRVSRKKKAAKRARKLAAEKEIEAGAKVDVGFLKCPECNCYLEDPVVLKCGHLICRTKCGEKTITGTWLECPSCHVKTDIDQEKGIKSLESITLFLDILAKLKSGVDPGIIPDFLSLQEKLNNKSFSEGPASTDQMKLLPFPLDSLKGVILQKQRQKIDALRPKGPKVNNQRTMQQKLYGKKAHERLKLLMKERAAKLIALPKDDRESLMKFWTSKGVRFPPPPSPTTMEQLHERCKSQARAFRIEDQLNDTTDDTNTAYQCQEKPQVPSLFDIKVFQPNRFSHRPPQRGPHLPPVTGGSLLRPPYIHGSQDMKWNIENEEIQQEEQWVRDEHFRDMNVEVEDFYRAVSDMDFHGPCRRAFNGPPTDPRGPRPMHPEQFQRHVRPPHGPPNFPRMPRIFDQQPRFMGPQHRPLRHQVPAFYSEIQHGPRPPRQPFNDCNIERMPYSDHYNGHDNQMHQAELPREHFNQSLGQPHNQQQYEAGHQIEREGTACNPGYGQEQPNGCSHYQQHTKQHNQNWEQPPSDELLQQQHVQQQPQPPTNDPQASVSEQLESYSTHQPDTLNQQPTQPLYPDQAYGQHLISQDQLNQLCQLYEPYDPAQPYIQCDANLYQPSKTQSQETLVTTDFDVQQRWSQAFLNLQQGITDGEHLELNADNNVETKSTDNNTSDELSKTGFTQSSPEQSKNDNTNNAKDTSDESPSKPSELDDGMSFILFSKFILCEWTFQSYRRMKVPK